MGIPQLRMTADEYLAFERAADGKHELWDGEVFAMSGASLSHNRIVRNLILHLGIECYTRQLDDSWVLRDHVGSTSVQLGPLAEPVSLDAIYDGVELAAGDD